MAFHATASSSLGSTIEVSELETLAKGTIIAGDGSGAPSTLAVGTNGKVLTADSTKATGLDWTAAGSGDMVLADVQTVTGAKTFGSAGAVGKLKVAGTTSGSTIIDATAVASGTLTLPAATDTLVGLATSDALTNKDISSATNTYRAASDTVVGALEVATTAETTTGTDATRAVSPDGLAGSTIFGTKYVQLTVFGYTTDCATGDGAGYFVVPASLNGMNLISVHGRAITAGTTGTMDVQIANVTDAVDMLSTKLTWDSTEAGTDTAATPAVIDGTKDDVATYDVLRVDVDAVQTTAAKGMIITLGFQLP